MLRLGTVVLLLAFALTASAARAADPSLTLTTGFPVQQESGSWIFPATGTYSVLTTQTFSKVTVQLISIVTNTGAQTTGPESNANSNNGTYSISYPNNYFDTTTKTYYMVARLYVVGQGGYAYRILETNITRVNP